MYVHVCSILRITSPNIDPSSITNPNTTILPILCGLWALQHLMLGYIIYLAFAPWPSLPLQLLQSYFFLQMLCDPFGKHKKEY